MYQLLDLRTCQKDITIHPGQSGAILDTEHTTIAAITGNSRLIYCNRAFLQKHDARDNDGSRPAIQESMPDLLEHYREPAADDAKNHRIINLRLDRSEKPLAHLLVSFEKDISQPVKSDLYTLVSADDHPDFINSYTGIYVANQDADTIKVNPSYEKIAFLPESDLVGRNLEELVEKGYFSKSVTLSILSSLKDQCFCKQALFQKLICGKEVLAAGTPIYTEQKKLAYILTYVQDLLVLETLARKCVEYDQQERGIWSGMQLSSHHKKSSERKSSRPVLPEFDTLPFIARDPLTISTFKQVVRAAGYDTPILLTGETGVGKDLMAKYIHLLRSAGRKQPFISVNCSAIPRELLESELFGYEEGAFSGASRKGRTGLFTAADGGILFLNEISEIPLVLQAKLLSALDEGYIRPLGSSKTKQVRARIICATNRDLGSCIEEGSFRSDLYYRIKVLTIRMGPLRERRRDILPLVHHFMAQLSEKYGLKRFLSPEVQQILLGYHWPGNVRELRNVVEQLLVFSSTDQVSVCDLPDEISTGFSNGFEKDQAGLNEGITLKKAVHQYERYLIEEALKTSNKTSDAARILGIDPTTLARKLRRDS